MVLRWFCFFVGGIARTALKPKKGEDEDALHGEDEKHGHVYALPRSIGSLLMPE